jgi:hypothetical protein
MLHHGFASRNEGTHVHGGITYQVKGKGVPLRLVRSVMNEPGDSDLPPTIKYQVEGRLAVCSGLLQCLLVLAWPLLVRLHSTF